MHSIAQYQFRPKWFFVILTAIFLTLFISLGFWQLKRADYKQELLQTYQQNVDSIMLGWQELSAQADEVEFYRIELTGYYDNQHTILLDNKTYGGKPGYHVLTPFYMTEGERAILINRGWIPLGESRQQLPQIPIVDGEIKLVGILKNIDQNQFILKKDANYEQGWPLRAQFIELSSLQPKLGYQIYDYMVWLNADQDNGFVRDWIIVSMPAEKHLGYAVQWFSLALMLLIIFVVLSVGRK